MKYYGQFKVATVAESSPAPYGGKLQTPEDTMEYWNTVIVPNLDLSKENLIVIALNSKFVPMGWNLASLGTVNECMAHPRDVFRPVVIANAVGFIVMHNHPSGDPSPLGSGS